MTVVKINTEVFQKFKKLVESDANVNRKLTNDEIVTEIEQWMEEELRGDGSSVDS